MTRTSTFWRKSESFHEALATLSNTSPVFTNTMENLSQQNISMEGFDL